MPAALLGATRCRRCGGAETAGSSCVSCGAAWAAAATGSAGRDGPAPLSGLVPASVGRRWAAHAVDLVVPALLAASAVRLVTAPAGPVPWWVPAALAVPVVVAQLAALVFHGRTVGRVLLKERTVDDLTGTPVRAGRLQRWPGGSGPRHRLVTADLRRGRDPLDLALPRTSTSARHDDRAGVEGPTATTPPGAPAAATPATAGASTRPSVGIVLDTGERYEISDALLIGRSPVDVTGSGDRALLAWPDLTRRLAKTHALLEWSGTTLWVTDLDTATGTSVVAPGEDRRLLAPGVRTAAAVGALIECGGRSMKVVPGA